MASEKTNLKKHIDYLEARRSGAEFCLDLVRNQVDDKPADARISGFIRNLNTSLQDNRAKLATIEENEREEKERVKAEAEASRKARAAAF